jgi:hypothetical protein
MAIILRFNMDIALVSSKVRQSMYKNVILLEKLTALFAIAFWRQHE